MSSADFIDDNTTTQSINGLPEYQQSIQNFVKRQLSNTTTAAASALLEADKDVIEIDLDEERRDILYNENHTTNDGYQSPVYPALFLNDMIGDNDEDSSSETDVFYGCTSAYEGEKGDYFSLCTYTQGKKKIYFIVLLCLLIK